MSGASTGPAHRGRLPLRHHVPLRLPDVAVDPERPRRDRARHPLAVLQPRGDQPRGGQEAPVGAGLVLRLVDDADRRPAPPRTDMALLDRWYAEAGTGAPRGRPQAPPPRGGRGHPGRDGPRPRAGAPRPSTTPPPATRCWPSTSGWSPAAGSACRRCSSTTTRCSSARSWSTRPTGEAAVRLWDLTTGWLEFPHVYEVQRPKSARRHRRHRHRLLAPTSRPGTGSRCRSRHRDPAPPTGREPAVLIVVEPLEAGDHSDPGHPERPARIGAAMRGVEDLHLGTDLAGRRGHAGAGRAPGPGPHPGPPRSASSSSAPPAAGRIDHDTYAGPTSWEDARLAAGAGLVAIEAAARPPGAGLRPRPAARPPRRGRPGHGLLPPQQRGRGRRRPRRRRRAGPDRRLGRPPRQRHPGPVLGRPRRSSTSPPTSGPAYPGTGRADEVGGPAARGTTVNVPLPPGATGDVVRRAFDTHRDPGRRGLRPHLGAGVGRLRRPPRRPAGRPGPVGRRLRRAGRRRSPGTPPSRDGSSSSSRAATTSTPCGPRWPPPSAAWSGAGPGADEAPDLGGPGDRAGRRRRRPPARPPCDGG